MHLDFDIAHVHKELQYKKSHKLITIVDLNFKIIILALIIKEGRNQIKRLLFCEGT